MKRIILSILATTLVCLNLNAQNMNKKALVVYFSATGTTATVANTIAQAVNADILEIEPAEAYTAEDLDWTNKKSRSTLEMKDKKSRPAMKNSLQNPQDYDIIYLGFPIWWYTAPHIVNTFLESTKLDGKTIVLFATSGGSGLGKTIDDLRPSAPNTTFINGAVLNKNVTKEQIVNQLRVKN